MRTLNFPTALFAGLLLLGTVTNLGNPRLKLGEISTAADGSITGEIVTVDGSLVQKLAFNRYPGLVRQIV
jgi:hypothetical protein